MSKGETIGRAIGSLCLALWTASTMFSAEIPSVVSVPLMFSMLCSMIIILVALVVFVWRVVLAIVLKPRQSPREAMEGFPIGIGDLLCAVVILPMSFILSAPFFIDNYHSLVVVVSSIGFGVIVFVLSGYFSRLTSRAEP